MDFGYRKTLGRDFDAIRMRLEEELKQEGFGVLTEIDVKATLKKKLDVDFRRYLILGACNPPFAHKALQQVDEVGLLMPCNIIMYENGAGDTVVSAMDVEVAMGMVVPQLMPLAKEVGGRLKRVIDRL
jgi:uncharacterized protein (DUF302 family)